MKEKKEIKECCQFRMLKVIVFFIALQICTNPVISQIISPYSSESAAYYINPNNSNDISSSHSQKILQYKDKLHIVLTHLSSNNQARFYLVERDDPNPRYIDIPIEYDVRDFSILGDTLYFCGAQTIPNETLTSGFIAYNSINSIFDASPSPCKYSNLRSVLVVNKIKTYYNSNKERMVVGIGEQYYGDVTFTPAPEHGYDPLLPPLGGKASVNTKIMGEDDQGNLWNDEAKKNWDCFIGYKVVELPNGNGVDNIYDIYRCHFGNIINGNPVEFLRDITLTDDYICLVSNYYPYEPGTTCNLQNIFLIRRIDKNNLVNQVTNRCNAAPSIGSTAHNFNLVKLEHLTGNDIAFCYVSQSPSNLESNAIYKIDLNSNPFTTLISSFIDENQFMRPLLWDLEYLKEENRLLVLKQQSNSNNNGIYSDCVYYISMNNSTILPYTTLALEVPYNTYTGQPLYWNSLLKYSSDHFALVGNIDNKGLTIYEKDAYSFFGGNGCNKLDSPIVQSQDNPITAISTWDMVHCKFLYMINQNQLLVGVNFLPSQILTNNMLVPAYHIHQITKYCENREINFHLPEPETHE
jgi:hypothetical protein